MQQKFWQRIRFIRWLIFLVMVGTVLAVFAGAKLRSVKRLLPTLITQATCDDAKISLNNFDYCDVREGNARWMLQAAGARYFDDKQETVLSQVSAVFYLKEGGTVELKGDEGVLHNDSNNMEVSGNVRVRYGNNYTLVTDRLLYDREKELIHTTADVFLEGRGITLKGQGMRLEVATRTVCILKHIETTLQGIIVGGKKRQSIS
jgi:LPS export ABC transporter protein LptC